MLSVFTSSKGHSYLSRILLLSCCVITLSACGTISHPIVPQKQQPNSRPASSNPSTTSSSNPKKTKKVESKPVQKEELKAAPLGLLHTTSSSKFNSLLTFYKDWKGTPYRYGGINKKGIDCSAFVQQAYRDVFGVEIPRTTAQQRRVGAQIDKKDLQIGDLIFFKISNRTWHVGIYIENDQFMHASRTYGVSVSKLNDAYWLKRYNSSRRIHY